MVSPHGTTPLTFSPASARAFPDEKNWRPRRDLRVAIGAATLIVSGLLCTPAGATLTPDEATPTTNTDVSSFVATGCGYDAWTGSARRVVHDIFPVAGSIAAGGLKIDRTYSSHNNALEQPDSPRSPGQQYVAARLSYSWSLRGLDGINDPIDIYSFTFQTVAWRVFTRPTVPGYRGTQHGDRALAPRNGWFFQMARAG